MPAIQNRPTTFRSAFEALLWSPGTYRTLTLSPVPAAFPLALVDLYPNALAVGSGEPHHQVTALMALLYFDDLRGRLLSRTRAVDLGD